MANFTEEEKVKARDYLGYASFESLAGTISFGFPFAQQPLFIVDAAFQQISEAGAQRVRATLCRLDEIECLIDRIMRRAGVGKAGTVELDARRGRMDLLNERRRLVQILADALGSFPNPHSQMYGVGDRRVIET